MGELPQFLVGGFFAGIFDDAEDAGEDADDVAVENGLRFVEGDAGNGAGGVTPDAGKGEDVVIVARKFAVMAGDNFPRGFLQVADAGVIAEAFPEFVDFFGASLGEGWDRGQFAHPALPIGDDGLDLGLLEHDFRDPDGVGIAGAAPGQIAGVERKPVEQGGGEAGDF